MIVSNPSGGTAFTGGTITSPLVSPAGTVNDPGISLPYDTGYGYGLYKPGSGSMGFACGGTAVARMTQSGELMVGTTTAIGRVTFKGTGTGSGILAAGVNSAGTTTSKTTDAGNIILPADGSTITGGTSGYGVTFRGSGSGIFLGDPGFSQGINIGSSFATCYGVHVCGSAPSAYDLGKSDTYWRSIYVDNTLTKGIKCNLVTKTANYTPTTTDTTILCDTTSAGFTITLPAAAANANRIYYIKKISADGNTLTIDGNASETIDGALTATTATPQASFNIQCDGSNWFIISLY